MKRLASLLPLLIATVLCQTDLILNNQQISLGGRHTYRNVQLLNGAKITVPNFSGDFLATGNLEMTITGDLTIDQTSGIFGRGAGWQPKLCSFGTGPYANSGGRGGCAVFDSGGGGAHLGSGGFGTKDCPNAVCEFPRDEEEACSGDWVQGNNACSDYSDCRRFQGSPDTIGIAWSHSVFDIAGGVGMGAAGGDKGCRDGDGRTALRGGAGGGRVLLNVTGAVVINGKINMDGHRGCSMENDSGGGGAGGTIIILATSINMGPLSNVTASGGLGGDSVAKDFNENPECINTQIGGTCDDCGGGGAGGIIYLSAASGNFFDAERVYDLNLRVEGAKGGACTGCNFEARGQDGIVSYGHRYEACDGIDNTYDGEIDENQPLLQPCGLPSCVNGVPVLACPNPTTAVPTTAQATTAQPTTAAPTTAQSTTAASSAPVPTSANSTPASNTVPATTGAAAVDSSASQNSAPATNQGTSPSNGQTNGQTNGGTSVEVESSASFVSNCLVFAVIVFLALY